MRTVGASIAALLLAACGASCPEPETGPSQDPEPSAEAPSMDGTWLLGEADDAEIEVVLELEGERGTLRAPAEPGEETMPVRVVPASDDAPARIVVREGGADEPLIWVPQGPGRALGLAPEDDDLILARRAAPIPAALHGKWVLRRADRREPLGRLSLSADAARMSGPRGGGRGAAYALPGPGDDLEIAMVDPSRPDSRRLVVVSIHAVGDGSFVAWPRGDDDYVVLHRPGARPSWLPEAPERAVPPPHPAAVSAEPSAR
ncbi:MAG TPA: hypothetical protein RMH99_08195 [Sandaracinaceae bacterium LLY-WYZ-13_1]|nr:hypothetical protein [Sandaracinaceae bacterium LLY-WYZ-13_1]